MKCQFSYVSLFTVKTYLVNLSPLSDLFGPVLSLCTVGTSVGKIMLYIAENRNSYCHIGLYRSLIFPLVRMQIHEKDKRRIKLSHVDQS